MYITLQNNRSLNFKTFLIWTFKSIYQACIIMFLAITCFYDSFTNIVTITFSTLVIIELLNVISEVHKIKTKMVLSIILTLIIYITSIVILRQYFQLSYITQTFVVQVLALSLACWLPLQFIQMVMHRFDPTEE